MKKTLSLFLALVMLLSCFTAFSVSAESGDLSDMLYDEETISASASALSHFVVSGLPEKISVGFEDFKKTDDWNKVNLMGMSLDFLYSASRPLYWAELNVYKRDENNKLVYGADGSPVLLISMDDISLAMTNISIYLQRLFYNRYGGLNLYSVENAVSMANMIGKLFYPDFKELNPQNYKNYFSNEVPGANEFFKGVVALSGLDTIINNNWIARGRSFYEPLVKMLGSDYMDFNDDYYADGLVLGSKILEAMVKKMIAVGPVDFVLDLLNVYASPSYQLVYREPTLALFALRIAGIGNHKTESELNSFDGLLHLVFCDCDTSLTPVGCYANADADHFVPFKFPLERYNSTTSKDEKFIYLYYYLNICGRYMGNKTYIEKVKNSINNSSLSGDDKTKLTALVDGFLLGQFDNAINNAIVPLYKENISTATDGIFDRMKNALMVFLKKIADYFDYLRRIFNGDLQYGQGNSPFN